MKLQVLLVLLLSMMAATNCGATFTNACLRSICQVESNCNPNQGCHMDAGSLSCGAYQIKQLYWIDCGRPGRGWQECANSLPCAESCVRSYMNRYGNRCTRNRNAVCQDYARVHNGGPRGCQSSATVGYWNRVSAVCGCPTCCD